MISDPNHRRLVHRTGGYFHGLAGGGNIATGNYKNMKNWRNGDAVNGA